MLDLERPFGLDDVGVEMLTPELETSFLDSLDPGRLVILQSEHTLFD
jgi:hypothetical protein